LIIHVVLLGEALYIYPMMRIERWIFVILISINDVDHDIDSLELRIFYE